jgi:hypothetical protein
VSDGPERQAAQARRIVTGDSKLDIDSNNIDLTTMVEAADRELLVAGLQSLYRERVAARNAAVSVAIMRGGEQPADEMFGIGEVAALLRRVGAAPASF